MSKGLRWTEDDFSRYAGWRSGKAGADKSDRVPSAPAVPMLLVKPAPDYGVFYALLLAAGCPGPLREHRFCSVRKFRFDFAWPEQKVAVEVEGGLWSSNPQAKAAHGRPLSILRDMEKSNRAALLGWRVLRYTPQQLEAAVPEIAKLVKGEP